MTQFGVEPRPSATYAALSMHVSNANKSLRVTEAFDALDAYLLTHGVEPSGPSIIRYRTKHDGRPFQIDVGYIVEPGAWIEAPYVLGSIPAGKYVCARFEGHKDDLAELEAQMVSWSTAEGYELAMSAQPDGVEWDSYIEYHLGGFSQRADCPVGTVDLCLKLR